MMNNHTHFLMINNCPGFFQRLVSVSFSGHNKQQSSNNADYYYTIGTITRTHCGWSEDKNLYCKL